MPPKTLFPLLALLAVFSTTGCNLLLNFSQCESNADCGGEVCSNGVCERPVCAGNDACASYGEDFTCVRGGCFAIDENICTVDGDLESGSGESLHIGALFPFTGRNKVKAEATYEGAKSALAQINLSSNGVRNVNLSMIRCDTENNADRAVEVARYLVDTVGVQSVLGSISSGETLEIAEEVVIPAGAALITPASTSTAIATLDDDDLVWRTIASDALQGPALAWLVSKGGYENIIVLRVQSAYGEGLFDAFIGSNTIPTDNLEATTYTVDDDGNLVADSIIDSLTRLIVDEGYQPDAIVVLGSVETQQIIFALDDTFFGELPEEDKPQWILSEAARDPGLLDARFSNVWPRISGTLIQTESSDVFDDFKLRYESAFERSIEEHPFADKAYDAAWLLALAHGANADPVRTTGADVAARLANTSSGDVFQPGDPLTPALDALQGGSIDYEGASGPVDFQTETGDVLSDIASWTIETQADGDPEFATGAVIYTAGGEQR